MAESAMAGETDLVLLRPPPTKSLSLNDRDRLMILGLMGVEVKSLELPKSPWPAAASQGRSMTLEFKGFLTSGVIRAIAPGVEIFISKQYKTHPSFETISITNLSRNQMIVIVHTCSASTI